MTTLRKVAEFFEPHDSTYWLTRRLILRGMGFIYFVAFLSLYHQLLPLLGSNGLTPVPVYLDRVLAEFHGTKAAAFAELPSIFWFDDSDAVMVASCIAGLVMAVAVMAGVANAILMAALWFLYMSFIHVGQGWYNFGWEIMTLEAGFLAVFLCPVTRLSAWPGVAPSRTVLWFYRWMLFRLMFGAGLIKLRGDPCWRDLTCLAFHYETQPIPNPASWFLHQLPLWAHGFGVLWNHFIELVAPFMLFGPRLVRRVGGLLMIAFQFMLIISGNLSFLNWLTIVICIACLDDGMLARFAGRKTRERIATAGQGSPPSTARRWTIGAVSALLLYFSINPVMNMVSRNQIMNTSFDPLHLVNTYGAFGHIGKVRYEVILQGTDDFPPDESATWKEYEFKAKPGSVDRRPPVIAPYHYRVDWLIWFAAMSNYQRHPWLVHLIDKLLENDPGALSLIAGNPFPDRPPRFIRAELYEYRFTRRADPSGAWWERECVAPYFPAVSRDNAELQRFLAAYGWSE